MPKAADGSTLGCHSVLLRITRVNESIKTMILNALNNYGVCLSINNAASVIVENDIQLRRVCHNLTNRKKVQLHAKYEVYIEKY